MMVNIFIFIICTKIKAQYVYLDVDEVTFKNYHLVRCFEKPKAE